MSLLDLLRRLPLLGFALLGLACPGGDDDDLEPTSPELGVIVLGLPEGGSLDVTATLDGGSVDEASVTVDQNAAAFVLARDLADGVSWTLALGAAPGGTTCVVATGATGTIATYSAYAEVTCTAGASESCNGLDDDGDGQIDEGFDADGDGFLACSVGKGAADCDDAAAGVFPGAPEICANGVDDDCWADSADLSDSDGDGAACDTDCDDADPTRSPLHAESCNGVDDDCDGGVDPGEATDADGDGLFDACDNLVEVGCDLFTVADVMALRAALPDSFCVLGNFGEPPPAVLGAVDIVSFTGLVLDWGGGAFEIAGSGWVQGETAVPFAAFGCDETLAEPGTCAGLGRPALVGGVLKDLEQVDACGAVALAGCL